jgi:ornithine--oxo-acid transaminase
MPLMPVWQGGAKDFSCRLSSPEIQHITQMNQSTSAFPTHTEPTDKKYADYVNPQWVRLLSVLGLNKIFNRSLGAELYADNGDVYLDFLSGYGVYNVGHHHPFVTQELIAELHSQRPSMLQSHVPTLAAELAEKLCKLAGGKMEKVYFGSSGSEGVESSIKFARAFTKRDWILYAEGGFHGLTCGALSLMSNLWWREGFGPLLRETEAIPFGDIEALRKALATEKFAAYIVEPIQGENGVKVPAREYLREAQRLCEKHGTLLVIDEVQTGIHRTGSFIASQYFGIEPDMVILAKALSGGQVPVGALLMRTDVCRSVYSSIDKAFVHASTFSENALAMRAGLATLQVVEREKLGERSTTMGEKLRNELKKRLARFEMVREIRGVGLFNAIEFQAPKSLGMKLLYAGFNKAHPGLFGQMLIKTLFEQEKILSQMAGNNFMVIKSLPPLVISEEQLLKYACAMERVCQLVVDEKTVFWTQGLKIAAKALTGPALIRPQGEFSRSAAKWSPGKKSRLQQLFVGET